MKKLFNKIGVLSVMLMALMLLFVTPSYAVFDLATVTVDTAPVFTLATTILVAIGGIWAIKKLIKLGNRS